MNSDEKMVKMRPRPCFFFFLTRATTNYSKSESHAVHTRSFVALIAPPPSTRSSTRAAENVRHLPAFTRESAVVFDQILSSDYCSLSSHITAVGNWRFRE